jgi:hypothetical protein
MSAVAILRLTGMQPNISRQPVMLTFSASGTNFRFNTTLWRHRNNKTIILGAYTVPIYAQKILLNRSATEGAPSPECTIKGSVSRNGERIYHIEGQRFYAKIRMDKGGDRRWFCTSEEAETAGWRRAVR